MNRFINDENNTLEEFERLENAQQWQDAERLAHTIKGTAANIGAQLLSDAFGEAEKACSRRQPTGKKLRDSIESLFVSTKEQIGKQLSDNPLDSVEAKAGVKINDSLIEELCRKLGQAINADDTKALTFINQLVRETKDYLNSETSEQLNVLKNSVESFDFELAQKLLPEMHLIFKKILEVNHD